MEIKKLWDSLDITGDIDVEKDTIASAFLKGATVTYIKTAVVCGVVHMGIKAYEQHKDKK